MIYLTVHARKISIIVAHRWDIIREKRVISSIFIVTNAIKYKHFERWATYRGQLRLCLYRND